MISSDCDISKFIKATLGKDALDIIELADKEATEAERNRYRSGAETHRRRRCGHQYAQQLKDLIFFIRYGVRPAGLPPGHMQLFKSMMRPASVDGRR
jgi:hypothetical protein